MTILSLPRTRAKIQKIQLHDLVPETTSAARTCKWRVHNRWLHRKRNKINIPGDGDAIVCCSMWGPFHVNLLVLEATTSLSFQQCAHKVMTRHVHAPPQHGLVLTFFNFFSKFLFFFCCIVSWSSENFLFTNEPSVWSRYFFVFFWTENPRRKEGCWRDRESYCTFLWLELGIQLESEDSFDRDVHDRRGCLLTVTVLMVH